MEAFLHDLSARVALCVEAVAVLVAAIGAFDAFIGLIRVWLERSLALPMAMLVAGLGVAGLIVTALGG